MKNIWVIARREYQHFFNSPVAYAIAFIILMVLGILFFATILAATSIGSGNQQVPTIQIIIGPLVTLFMFSIPAITMRTIAEEQKNGTLELILTAPVQDWELIVGKWLGSFFFVLTIVAITWVYPLILNQIISPGIDQGILITNYLGLVLLISAFVAIGVAISSLFSNQLAAMFATLGVFLIMWMISYPSQVQSMGGGSEILRYLDFSEHFYSTFYQGIIELKDIIFFISVTGLALFFGTLNINSRRWR